MGSFRGTKVLPDTERESQIATLLGVLVFFFGLFAASATATGIGAVVTVFGVIAWVIAARKESASRRDVQP